MSAPAFVERGRACTGGADRVGLAGGIARDQSMDR